MKKLLSLWLLGFVVFFGRWALQGLSPDAALYAGLSYKVLQTREYWYLSGTQGFFPHFFEHPPFFFQWGSWVLSLLGTSDGAARAIGAFPGFLGFCALMAWSCKRLGFPRSFLLALLLLSFGHYTKYAATVMLEGPLSLGVILVVIGTVEFLYQGARAPAWTYWACALGACLSVASKGVAGLGALGAVVLSLFAISCLKAYPHRGRQNIVLLSVTAVGACLPLLVWAWFTHSEGGGSPGRPWYFWEYLQQQVLRSFTTNRGSELHSVTGSKFRYVQVILKYGWPWWWTVPAGYFVFFRTFRQQHLRFPVMTVWMIVAAATFFSFFVPFSLSTFQLPHYLHPVYLPLAPTGAFFAAFLLERFRSGWERAFDRPAWVFLLGIVVGGAMLFVFRGVSDSGNRGQEFIEVAPRVASLKETCSIVVPEQDVDAYRMEAYALWYFRGRPWKRVSSVDMEIQNNKNHVIWYPQTTHKSLRLVMGADCL